MTEDTKGMTYPDLRASIVVALEVVGYRLPGEMSPNALAMRAFRCSGGEVTRRLDGKRNVPPGAMSRLVQELTLARDGITPDDFRHGPGRLKDILRSRGIGLYGRSTGAQLHRAVRDFDGPRADLKVRRATTRAGGFTYDQDEARARLQILYPGQPLRFLCSGPPDYDLILLDHAPDSGTPDLLVPPVPGAWSRPDAEGAVVFPGPDDAPLYVRPDTEVRQVIALWLPRKEARAIDSATPVTKEAFRRLSGPVLDRICGLLRCKGMLTEVRAVADLYYRAALIED